MMGNEIGKTFVSEFVIGLGLLSGIWIHIGTNPEEELFKVLATLNPDPTLGFFFWLFPLIITILSWVGAFTSGGWIGLIATTIALICGIFLTSTIMPYLLIIAFILGFIAPHTI